MKRTFPALVGLALAAILAGSSAAERPPRREPPPRSESRVQPRPQPRPLPMAQPAPRRENSLGADWRLQQDEVRQGVRQRQLMPLGRVIAQIGARTPGRQLDTGLENQGGRPVYRVRWMTRDGRRVDYLIDAATGAILSGG